MKRTVIAVLIACMTLFAFVGCEKLPEEPEATNTPSPSSSETRDDNSDSAEATPEPEGETPEGEEDAEEDGEEIETSEESEEDGEDEEDPTFSYTRRSREEIEAELNIGVSKYDSGSKSIRGLTGSWRMIPPAGGWAFARGGVVRKEEPVATAEPGAPTPRPTATPKPTMTVLLNANKDGIEAIKSASKAYLYNKRTPMIDIRTVVRELGGYVSESGMEQTISLNGQIAYVDLSAGTCRYGSTTFELSAPPQKVGKTWYVPLNVLSMFIGSDLYFNSEDVVINIPPKASKTTAP